jgi:hypothetical protein
MTKVLAMIYARSTTNPRGLELSTSAARSVSTTALIAYPAGALILRFGPDTLAGSLMGYGMILVAVVMAALLSGSTVQRIAAEEPAKLDEFELALRAKALGFSYACLSALVLASLFYAGVAVDAGGWVPTAYDEFNGLFWGVFLYANVLPSAVIAWKLGNAEEAA